MFLCFATPNPIPLNSEEDKDIPYPCGPIVKGKRTNLTFNQAAQLYHSRRVIALEEIGEQIMQQKEEAERTRQKKTRYDQYI